MTPGQEPIADRLYAMGAAAMDALTVALGRDLGLYGHLPASGRSADEFASAAGIDSRYALEWLEQQASAGIVDVDDPAAVPGERRYSLSAEATAALTDPDDPTSIGPLLDGVASMAAVIGILAAAYRTGDGVAFSRYPDFSRIQGDFNRPVLLTDFPEWLRGLPVLNERLASADAPARVLEVGCGEGWGSIGIARAWPHARVDGLDIEPESIDAARAHAVAAGVSDRVSFVLADGGAKPVDACAYDLVFAYEMVHDLSDPVAVLATMRTAVAPGGTVLVFDERVPEEFTAGADPVERLMYAFSVLLCLPTARVDAPSAATGTVMRPSVLREYALAAGFSEVETLDGLGTELIRGYRLVTDGV